MVDETLSAHGKYVWVKAKAGSTATQEEVEAIAAACDAIVAERLGPLLPVVDRLLAMGKPPPLAPDEYQCAKCREVFKKGWSEEEAQAESAAIFGELPDETSAVVCDECWKALGFGGEEN